MPHFVRDDIALPADKVGDVNAYNNPSRQWGTTDANAVFDALDDIKGYLREGVLDASDTTTIGTANITTGTLTTAAITTATITHTDLIADQVATVGPEQDWKGYQGRWFIGVDVANAPTSRDFVHLGVRGSYSFPDGVTTSGSPTLTSPTGGGFVTALIGSSISGAGIPVGTTITAVGGTTSLTMSTNATISATGVRVTVTRNTVQDLMYWKHRGALSPTCGIGVTPPDGSARLQVSPQDDEVAMGTMRLRKGPSQTGKVLALHDSAPTDMFWVDSGFYLSGAHASGAAIVVQSNQANDRPVAFVDKNKTSVFGWEYPSGGGGVLQFRYLQGGVNIMQFGTDGTVFHYQAPTFQSLATFQSGVVNQASLRLTNEIAPAQITANQNDYAPTGFATAAVLILTSDASRDITGFAAPSTGRVIWLFNNGAQNIVLKHDVTSTAANRIIGRGAADTTLTPKTGAQLYYSTSLTRWIILGDTL